MVALVFDQTRSDEDIMSQKAPGDENTYTIGTIGKHNVVLAYMPNTGSVSAATVTARLQSTFTKIEIAFVVGVCGVTPKHATTKEEIVLGDCIISTAVVQYNLGRQYPGGFDRKKNIEDSLGRANSKIRALFSKLKSLSARRRLQEQLMHHLKDLQAKGHDLKYPGRDQDWPFKSSYQHQHRSGNDACDKCLKDIGTCTKDCKTIECDNSYPERPTNHEDTNLHIADHFPMVHFGRFGSANTVMKSGLDRDSIAEADEIVAFEMESWGVWDIFPTIVIKSACDYADSHKNKEWQTYAAATAAAGMKAFLEEWKISDQSNTSLEPTPQKVMGLGTLEISHMTGITTANASGNATVIG